MVRYGRHVGVTLLLGRDGVVVGPNAPTYLYTGLEAEVGHVFSVTCTVSHPLGIAVSNAASLVVQVGAQWSLT